MGDFAFIKRAEAHAEHASQWHQGSGAQADIHASAAARHVELAQEHPDKRDAHIEAAKAHAEAAKQEAKLLRETGGNWPSWRQWQRSPAGKASKRAVEASKRTGTVPDDF